MKFGNANPDTRPGAYEWLSRGLKEAIIAFIKQARSGDKIYGSFYEFRNDEILTAFKEAALNGVELHLIYDAKDNQHYDSNGDFVESFPKVQNEEAITRVGLDALANVTMKARDRNKSYLSHNKFMILEQQGQPTKVWTGSTNISKGGFSGKLMWDILLRMPRWRRIIKVIGTYLRRSQQVPT